MEIKIDKPELAKQIIIEQIKELIKEASVCLDHLEKGRVKEAYGNFPDSDNIIKNLEEYSNEVTP
jgi:hypothetical protein